MGEHVILRRQIDFFNKVWNVTDDEMYDLRKTTVHEKTSPNM
jgi:hypothetical protein